MKILIEGVTLDGAPFRPADWADRMCGSLSTFKGHRIVYSPLLQPATHNNQRCVIMDEMLKTDCPELFADILDFAKKNDLKISPYREGGT